MWPNAIAARGSGDQWWYALLFGGGRDRIEVLEDAMMPMLPTRESALKAGLRVSKKLAGPARLGLFECRDGWHWEWWLNNRAVATKPLGFCYTTRRSARRAAMRWAVRLNLWEDDADAR